MKLKKNSGVWNVQLCGQVEQGDEEERGGALAGAQEAQQQRGGALDHVAGRGIQRHRDAQCGVDRRRHQGGYADEDGEYGHRDAERRHVATLHFFHEELPM
ncbi:hypothetical protein [Pseudomonas tohonis]|uniref:hypothetical protein n=1 Tax=Pseudomonas tohonis TaxID=2725477 RepID=UPI001F30B8D1|nr:hypothetical protein [Pseudomonas tohonis]